MKNFRKIKTGAMTIAFLCCAQIGFSQTIVKFSIDSGGASFSGEGLNVLYSIGEPVVQEFSGEDFSVSEGFINGGFDSTLNAQTVTLDDKTIHVYPNPTFDFLNVSTALEIKSLELFDVLGKRVLTVGNRKIMNVAALQAGLYLLKINTVNGDLTKRVIIK